MIIELRFDYYLCALYVPNGVIRDISTLQKSFFDWVAEQASCINVTSSGNLAYCYDENDFLRYLNDVVLEKYCEKAYFVQPQKVNTKYKITLKF